MTYIPKPSIDDSEVLNIVSRDLLFTDKGETKLLKRFKVVTEEGVVHELTFGQLEGLINILDSSRPTAAITPLQYLVAHYGLTDILELGKNDWFVSEYTVIVLADSKVVRFDGVLTKPGEVRKVFSYALGSFDFIQQLSLARCIVSQHKDFEKLKGTYDVSYMYKVGPDGQSISSDLRGIDEKQFNPSA